MGGTCLFCLCSAKHHCSTVPPSYMYNTIGTFIHSFIHSFGHFARPSGWKPSTQPRRHHVPHCVLFIVKCNFKQFQESTHTEHYKILHRTSLLTRLLTGNFWILSGLLLQMLTLLQAPFLQDVIGLRVPFATLIYLSETLVFWRISRIFISTWR